MKGYYMDKDYIFLEEIKEKLNSEISKIDDALQAGNEDIASMQEYYWLNYSEMDEYGYEAYDNQQALFMRENANQEDRILRMRYKKMLSSPYFGRVDFKYDGEDESETFYIGIGNFSPKKGMAPLIYDWRAPVCSLFYDYDAGPASYEAPLGTITGTVTDKYQYKIKNGKFIYAVNSDIKIDDEVLLKELSGKGSNVLKNIVRTIQKEQNAIIRNTKDEILVIQGVAGSGKTSVALHRIAYLLYHEREHLKSKNVLILSPNGIFADYISHILPELGEENILEMSFDTFAYRQLRDIVSDIEDRCSLMENMLSGDQDPALYSVKSSADFVGEMEGYIYLLEDELVETFDIHIRKWVKPAREIEELFYRKFTDFPLLSRMDVVREHVIDEFETLFNTTLSQEENDLLKELFDSMFLTKDIYIIYSRFLEEMGYEGLPHLTYENRILKYADVYPMLYMKYLLSSSVENKQIKHLVIDEMQDYSYLQYRILDLMFNCKMTILGDLSQTMDSIPRDVTLFLPKIFGKNRIKKIEMTKSYRNTVEIAKYASMQLNQKEPDLFERHGSEVNIINCDNIISASDLIIKELKSAADNDCETMAVITFTEKEAGSIYSLLMDKEDADTIPIQFINHDSKSFSTGVTVIPYYLAKGLEFERVYFIDHNNLSSEIHSQARFIAATRALHQLTVYSFEND